MKFFVVVPSPQPQQPIAEDHFSGWINKADIGTAIVIGVGLWVFRKLAQESKEAFTKVANELKDNLTSDIQDTVNSVKESIDKLSENVAALNQELTRMDRRLTIHEDQLPLFRDAVDAKLNNIVLVNKENCSKTNNQIASLQKQVTDLAKFLEKQSGFKPHQH